MMMLVKLLEVCWPLTYLAGLFVTIRYFRNHGKPVLILLCVYFALGVYSHTLSRPINRFFMSRSVSEITQEQIERYEAFQAEVSDLQLKYPDVVPGTAVKRVDFPLGQILLVATLFLLGRRMKQETPNQALHGTADSRGDASASVP